MGVESNTVKCNANPT